VARLAELGHRFRRTRAGRILTHPLAAVVLLPVLLFPQVFLRGYVLSPADQLYDLAPWSEYRPPGFQHASNPLRADDTFFGLPRRVAVASDILRFGVRLWQDHTFAGTPNTLPLGLGSLTYPPALSFFVVPAGWANTIVMISALLLAGVCMYLLLGLLTPSRGARLFGSVAWMLNGYFIVWLGATTLPLIFAVLPLLMFLATRFLEGRGALYGVGVAVLIGWTFFLSYPPANFVEAVLLALYVGCVWARSPRQLSWPVLKLAGFGLLGAGIGALPVLTISSELTHLLNSGYRPPRAPLSLGNLQTFLFPNTYGSPVQGDWHGLGNYSENIAYPGGAALLSAGVGALAGRARLLREPLLAFAVVAGLLSLVAAYGLSPLGRGFDNLPLLNSVVPARWQVGIDLAVAILACEGFARLGSGIRAWPLLAAGGVLAVAMAGLLARRLPAAPDGFVAGDFLLRAAFLLLALGALALVWRGRAAGGRALLVAVLAADLLTFGYGFNPAIPSSEFYPTTPALAYLSSHSAGYRVLAAVGSGAVWPGDVLNMYGVDSVTGYDNYRDDRFLNLIGESVTPRERNLWIVTGSIWIGTAVNLDSPAWNELGVRYAYFADDTGSDAAHTSEHWQVVYAARDGRIYENRLAQTKQFLVPEGGAQPVAIQHLPAEPDADHLTVQGPGVLVWSRPDDPGWEVTVNGRPVATTTYHGFFQSVPVGAGANSVGIAYRPRLYYYGALVSLASLLLAGVIAGFDLLRRRRVR